MPMFMETNSITQTVNPSAVATVLTESYDVVSTVHDIDPMKQFDKVIIDNQVFDTYINALTESLDADSSTFMKSTAPNIRQKILLEAQTFGTINPYQKMLFPLFRVFFPRLIAKEAITLGSIDAPSVVKYFIRYVMELNDGTKIDLPSYTSNPAMPIPATALDLNYTGNVKTDLVGLTGDAAQATVNRTFKLATVTDADGNVTEVNVQASVDGGINAPVTLGNGTTDVIVGHIDYQTGELVLSAAYGNAKQATVSGTISTELNTNNRRVAMVTDKINIETQDKELQTNWTIDLEQDAKALLDVDLKSEMIAILGAQIATEIDAEVINDLVMVAETQHPAAVDQFSTNPPANYAFGPKSWHENVIPVINKISNTIYNDTNIGQGNVILLNPLDATVLQSLDVYTAMNLNNNGELIGGAYEMGTIQNKWKVLISPLVPKGKAPIVLRTDNEKTAVYTLFYYQPLYIQPFPLGTVPSLTLKSRYARTLIRKEGIGLLRFV
jgi:hypothetical protein